jgi:hypothetical protein
MSDQDRIGPGDVVRHRPSGEEWTVAYADYERGDLSWSGWPEGIAKLSDCTLVRKAPPDERAAAILAWTLPNHGNDHRAAAVRRLYPSEVAALDHGRRETTT